ASPRAERGRRGFVAAAGRTPRTPHATTGRARRRGAETCRLAPRTRRGRGRDAPRAGPRAATTDPGRTDVLVGPRPGDGPTRVEGRPAPLWVVPLCPLPAGSRASALIAG